MVAPGNLEPLALILLHTSTFQPHWPQHCATVSVTFTWYAGRVLTTTMVSLFMSADLNSREQETLQPVHVINVDIQDNHEEATLGAFLICELCQCVSFY